MSKQLVDQIRRYLKLFDIQINNRKYKEANISIAKAESIALNLKEERILIDILAIRDDFGNRLTKLREFVEARNQYDSALKIAEYIVKNEPNNSSYQLLLAISLDNLGSSYIDTYNDDLGEFYCKKADTISKKLHDEYLDNLLYDEFSAMNSRNLGTSLKRLGNYSEAKVYLEKSIKLYEELIEKDPQKITYKSNIAASLTTFGGVLTILGIYNDAITIFENAVKFNEELVQIYPEIPSYKLDLFLSLNNYGTFLGQIGKFDNAEICFDKALDGCKELFKNNPGNESYKSTLAMIYANFTSSLMDQGKYTEAKETIDAALKLNQELVDEYPDTVYYKYNLSSVLTSKGSLQYYLGKYDDAQSILNEALIFCQEIVDKNPRDIQYKIVQSAALDSLAGVLERMNKYAEADPKYGKALDVLYELIPLNPSNEYLYSKIPLILNNYSGLLFKMCEYGDAKSKCDEALDILTKLIKKNPGNQLYQTTMGLVLNNIGNIFMAMGDMPDAKNYYERALGIYDAPSDYKTIQAKSSTIINLIQCNLRSFSIETNITRKLGIFNELCQIYDDTKVFFIENNLKYERFLVKSAGIYAHIHYLMLIAQSESDVKKRIDGYEACIAFVEKCEENKNLQDFRQLLSPMKYYLKGRLLINRSIQFPTPDAELIVQAVDNFKLAKDAYPNADACYQIYSGLLKINNIQTFDADDVSKMIEDLQIVIDSLPEKNANIISAFEEIKCFFDEGNVKNRIDFIQKLNQCITEIDYSALRKHFNFISSEIASYLEEPYNPNVLYSNWELTFMFNEPEKVKGKLTIKVGGNILFEEPLRKRTRFSIKYQPNTKEESIEFMDQDGIKILRKTSFFDIIKCGNPIETHILQTDFKQPNNSDYLKIAIIQLKYNLYKEDNVIKLRHDNYYCEKIKLVLEALKEKADIIVFPELSIPFNYLPFLKSYSENNGIVIVAGSHYVTEENLESYSNLFDSIFEEKDLLKNISPIIIPSSKIIHTEKICGSKLERPSISEEGMTNGNLNRIFKLQDGANCGVMICYDFLKEDLRQKIVTQCNIIFVPQANSNNNRFEDVARYEITNPRGPGNKAFIMANGIFTFNDEPSICGGSSGLVLTLDKYSHQKDEDAIVKPINGVMEQFILLASLDINFFAARETQQAQIPLSQQLIHIFEEDDVLQSQKGNALDFLTVLENINSCVDRNDLKQILSSNEKVICDFSPLMHKHISSSLVNLKLDEIKSKCCSILIKAN